MREFLDSKLAKKLEKEEKRKKNPPVNDDEEEETYLYDIRKPMEFINESENGVFDITKQTGINTAKSVFDKGSVFRT
jgi:sialic acid synthase SpsE